LAFSRKAARNGKSQIITVMVPRMALMGCIKKRVKSQSDLIMLVWERTRPNFMKISTGFLFLSRGVGLLSEGIQDGSGYIG
jgi:hypothetical protein